MLIAAARPIINHRCPGVSPIASAGGTLSPSWGSSVPTGAWLMVRSSLRGWGHTPLGLGQGRRPHGPSSRGIRRSWGVEGGQDRGLTRGRVGGVDVIPSPARGVASPIRCDAGGGAHGSGGYASWGSRHVGRPLSIAGPRGRGTRNGVPEMFLEPLEQ